MKTFKDIYKFPIQNYHGRFYDNDNNFLFQTLFYNKEKTELLLDVLNGKETLKNPELKFEHIEGKIIDNSGEPLLLIRGWGNLTGIGGHNLSPEEAANIQDTFAQYIVEKLNFRE
jgi:hypothetical protein